MPAVADAPPAKPVTAPTPASVMPKSDAPPSPSEKEHFSDAYADLDAIDSGKTPPPSKRSDRTAPKVEPSKVEPPKGAEKPKDEQQPAKPDETQAQTQPAEVKPVKAAELRTAYEESKKARKELEGKLQASESRVKELEAQAANGELKVWQEKAQNFEKRNQELESEIRFVNYAKSKEFVDQYQKPYEEAWARAVSDFNQLMVRVQTGKDELGEPTFGARKATADDLLRLANMPLSEMDAEAEAMFGKSAPRVIRHVEKVRELADAQDKALEDARKNGAARQEAQTAEQRARQAKIQENNGKLWQQYNSHLPEKYPKLFAPVEGDKEGNDWLTKGFAEADRLFSPTKDTQPKTQEEAVRLHALIRYKAANHNRLAHWLKQKDARIAELEASLKAYEESEPPAGKGGTATKPEPAYMDSANAELEALDRKA